MKLIDNPITDIQTLLMERILSVRPADFPAIDRTPKRFALIETDEAGATIAGAYAYQHPGWIYLDLLWVDEKRRGAGLGRKLISSLEAEARARACVGIYLWTQDFEAPGFYEKLGYEKFVSFDDFIPGHRRMGFMKRIAA